MWLWTSRKVKCFAMILCWSCVQDRRSVLSLDWYLIGGKGHTEREWYITICSAGFDIISSSLLYVLWCKLVTKSVSLVNTEFNKLRGQLQRLWSHIKIKLCVRLSALRWFYVGHVYKIGEVSFHLIGRNGFHVRGKNCPQAACRTSSTILFPHSTNQIIDLWRCRRCCRRRFVQNSLIGSAAHASSENAHGSPSEIPWLSQLFCECANFLARLQGSGWRRAARRTGLSFIPSLHQKSIKK